MKLSIVSIIAVVSSVAFANQKGLRAIDRHGNKKGTKVLQDSIERKTKASWSKNKPKASKNKPKGSKDAKGSKTGKTGKAAKKGAKGNKSTPPSLQFSMKYFHGCAVYSSKVQCVGYNNYGQVSDSSSDLFVFPEENSASPIKVVTGAFHTCVLMDDKSVWCKGDNANGQLGDVTSSKSSVTPVQVKNGDTEITNAVDIEAGYDHNCIKLDDDSLYCFGLNDSNQLGFNGETNVKLMALSDVATCVVKNSKLNEVVCKGDSDFNDKPYSMGEGEEIVKLVSGEGHFCVLLKSKKAKCFGDNFFGQLGNGNYRTSSYTSAVDVVDSSPNGSPLSDITDINAGWSSTCLVVSNKTPMCFGFNGSYPLGIANEGEFGGADVVVPTELDVNLPTGDDIASIHVGTYTGHVVYQDNSVFSWGDNYYGALGDGSDTSTVIGDTVGEDAVEMAFNWN